MSSLVDNNAVPFPRLELPSWLDDYPAVAEQAECLYDFTLQWDPKYQPPHVAERARQIVDELKRRNDPLIQRFSEEERPFSQEQRSRLVASLKVLCRLASDPRMRLVWQELDKKSRADQTKFVHPVKRKSLILEKLTTLHDPKNQDEAAQAFLNYAFLLAVVGPNLTFMTQAQVDAKLKPLRMRAIRWREVAQDLRALGQDRLATDLEVIADCDNSAIKPEPNIFFPVVKRRRGDQVVRSFVLRLSAICLEGFEKVLTRTVATTASVALSAEITGQRVHDIVRPQRVRG